MNIRNTNYEDECLSHMHTNGIHFDGPLECDGEVHRFSSDAKKHQPDEWYICYAGISLKGNPYLTTVYGTWSRGGQKFIYHSYANDKKISEDEQISLRLEFETRKKEVEKKLEEDKAKRIEWAKEIWEQSIQTPRLEHKSYLERKKINAYGLKYRVEYDGACVIVIPLCNSAGELQAVQRIFEDGDKKCLGIKKGNFHVLGEIKEESAIYFAEGYATAASVHEATGCPVVMAVDCGNFYTVVGNLRMKYPKHKFIIAADNDTETPGNPGKTKAEDVATAHNCSVVVPTFSQDLKYGTSLSDFNDLHVLQGLEEVKRQLGSLKPYLKTLNVQDLFQFEFPPRRLILSPWLAEKGLTMIYAARGIGKTFLSLSIGYAIASGESILGWHIPEARKVLYIDGEMPGVTLQERIKSISRSFPQTMSDPSNFRLVPQEIQLNGIKDLATLNGQYDINEIIKDVDVVILDNLSTLIRSGIENEAESWVTMQEWALSLRKAGKAIIFIHHAGKNNTSRGTSKREDILDSILMLKRPPNYSSKDGARFEIHFEKARGFYGVDAEPFEASLVEIDGSLTWKRSQISNSDLEIVLSMYREGKTNQRKISEETGMALGKVNKLIKEAKENGLIRSSL